MTTQKNNNSNLYYFGIVLLIASLTVYCIPEFAPFSPGGHFGLFAINYLIAIVYFVLLVIQKKLKKKSGGRPLMFVLLVLLLVSAWSLNRSIPVFEKSTIGLTVAMVISSIGCLLINYYDNMPKWGKSALMFILGFALAVFIYLSLYLTSLYPISIFGLIGFGISVHSFVPLLFVIFLIVQFVHQEKYSKLHTIFIISGAFLPLLIAIIFTIRWNNLNSKVSTAFQQSLIDDNTDLPGWVRVAEAMPVNPMTEKYLKSDLVYTLPSQTWNWSMPSRSFDEIRYHNPLIMFAALFSRPPALSQDERIKILESIYDARHKTLNRLWSGDHLITRSVISNVRIWPESRIAYTEKTITVLCDESGEGWRRRREAIYTFHLPEGGVVTSLSLWINGKEEKARLTTRSKADSAYKTIVGVESRDPSVVHWQEGNTVSVRVFPILSAESRVFKIGVTAPLQLQEDQLEYENIYFSGPDASNATEIVQIDWASMPTDFSMPEEYKANGRNRYIKKSDAYNPHMKLVFKDPGIKSGVFSFDDYSYTIAPYERELQDISFSNIYLDINKEWAKDELNEIYGILDGNIHVYAHTDRIEQLTGNIENDDEVLEVLKGRHFSLFPYYSVKDKANSLVITKGTASCPNLNDLKESDFGTRLEGALNNEGKYNVFCLGMQESPYIKTMKEHRVFNYAKGDISLLKKYINSKQFPINNENDSMIVVENADVSISKNTDKGVTNAPDHLMRLFAYNSIMQQSGKGIYTNHEINDTLVSLAEQAYIVSPLSSLVVLETQKDYDRFDIKKSKNSLQNATLKSGGAVPEPEEWALIIIALTTIILIVYNRKNKAAMR